MELPPLPPHENASFNAGTGLQVGAAAGAAGHGDGAGRQPQPQPGLTYLGIPSTRERDRESCVQVLATLEGRANRGLGFGLFPRLGYL